MTENHRHLAPVPTTGEAPIPAWVVTTGGNHDGYEIAALFADGHDAHRYATWWNREELHRYGNLSTHATATAIPEEIDFYPTGTWRPPTHLCLTETSRTPSPSTSPVDREPTIGGPTDEPSTLAMAQPGVHHQCRGTAETGHHDTPQTAGRAGASQPVGGAQGHPSGGWYARPRDDVDL